jgi:hypothetical protein
MRTFLELLAIMRTRQNASVGIVRLRTKATEFRFFRQNAYLPYILYTLDYVGQCRKVRRSSGPGAVWLPVWVELRRQEKTIVGMLTP